MNNRYFLIVLPLIAIAAFFFGRSYDWGTSPAVSKSSSSTGSRAVSSEVGVSLDESKRLREINKAIVSIKSKEEIEAMVLRLQKTAKENPKMQAVRLYAAVTRPLLLMKGVAWRLREVVESCRLCHVTALKSIRDLYFSDYMRGPHVNALIDYLVEPTTTSMSFTSFGAFQDYLLKTVAPELDYVLSEITDIENSIAPGHFFELDAYLFTGYSEKKRFISDKNRNSMIVQGNLDFMKSAVNRALGSIYYVSTFNLEKLPDFMNDVIAKSAISNIGSEVKPTSPIEYLNVLYNKGIVFDKFKSLGKHRESFTDNEIADYMSKSFSHFADAADNDLSAFKNSLEQSNMEESGDYLISPKLLSINEEEALRNLNAKVEMYSKAKANQLYVGTSIATGQQYSINLKAVFKKHKSLQDYLPKEEFKSKERYTVKEGIKKWDYRYGEPINWKDPTFGGLLPKANNSNLLELVRTLKLTAETRDIAKFLPVP
jgi:hypothetical protein